MATDPTDAAAIDRADAIREAGCRVHLKPNLLGRTNAGHPGMQMPDECPEHATPAE